MGHRHDALVSDCRRIEGFFKDGLRIGIGGPRRGRQQTEESGSDFNLHYCYRKPIVLKNLTTRDLPAPIPPLDIENEPREQAQGLHSLPVECCAGSSRLQTKAWRAPTRRRI